MAYKKVGNISIVIGTYEDASGKKKYNNMTLVTHWKNEDGKELWRVPVVNLNMQLNYLANKERKPDIFASYFNEKTNDSSSGARKQESAVASTAELDDEIPF